MRIYRTMSLLIWTTGCAFSLAAQQKVGCQDQDLANAAQNIADFRLDLQRRGFSDDQIKKLTDKYQDETLSSLLSACKQGKPAAQPVSNPLSTRPLQGTNKPQSVTIKNGSAKAGSPSDARSSSAALSQTVESVQAPAQPGSTGSGSEQQNGQGDPQNLQGVGPAPKPGVLLQVSIEQPKFDPTEIKLCETAYLRVQVNTYPKSDTSFDGDQVSVTDKPDSTTQAMPQAVISLQKDGTGQVALSGIYPGRHNFYLTFQNMSQKHEEVEPAVQVPLLVDTEEGPAKPCIHRMPPIMLTAVGVDVESASSASPGASFLGNVSLDFPILPPRTVQNEDNEGNPKRLTDIRLTDIHNAWVFLGGSLRIAGMAQPGSLSSAAFTSIGYYASAANATPDKIVQAWEGVGSLSVKLTGTDLGIGTFDGGKPLYASYPRRTYVSTSLLLSGGFTSPLSASQASPSVFYATSAIQTAYPKTPWATSCTPATPTSTPTCYVAFIPEDRTRFYRHYEAGLRLRIYGEDFDHHILRFPGIMDLTVGQNEYVTGGKLNGAVLHLGGLLPLPIPKVDGIYAFGAVDSAVNGPLTSCSNPTQSCAQLLLSPVPSTANVNYLSPSVYDVTVSQPNRDRYRFGFGIDIYHLITAKSQTSNASGLSK